MMADTFNQQTLRVAADWWLRLRDQAVSEQTMEQWLAWTMEDAEHLSAFERVNDLGMRFAGLGQVAREQLIEAFAPGTTKRQRRWPMAAAAAVVAVAALGGYLIWAGQPEHVVPTLYSSERAARRDIALEDGSHIAMGGATRLTTRLGRDVREVELAEGEAYFEVAHDEKRPFVVQVGKISIHDVGTAFDVRRTGDRVTIAMAEGSVRIFDASDKSARGLDAVAGQLVAYDPLQATLSVSRTDPTRAAAWRDARLEFDNEPLSVVVANINRYSARPVRIADNRLGALTFTGTVRTDAIDDWLHALPQVLPLSVREAGGQMVLSDARGVANGH